MRRPHPRVVCVLCGHDTDRVWKEDGGGYGPCRKCGGELVKLQIQRLRQDAKAKQDLRELGAE